MSKWNASICIYDICKYRHIITVPLETKLILAVYFVVSCSWITFLKKQRRTLAANHLMKTNLTFCFLFTEDLVD